MGKKNRRNENAVDISLERGQVSALMVGSVLTLGVVFLVGVGFGRKLVTQEAGPPVVPSGGLVRAPMESPKLTFHETLTGDKHPDEPVVVAAAPEPRKQPGPEAAGQISKKLATAALKATAKPAKKREAAPAPAAVAAPKDAADKRYSVQVASSQDAKDTAALVDKLKDAGYDARVVTAQIPGRGQWYRVWVGNYDNRDDAAMKQAELRVATNMAGFVVVN